MINNFNDPDGLAALDVDICIVGSGVAGLVMAHEFIGHGKKVLVLEAGGRLIEPESQELYGAEVVGCDYRGHEEGRFRVFGGTSTRWGGQLLPLDPADFRRRETVAGSGWPLSGDDLEPYYARALEKLKADDLPYDKAIWPWLKLNPYRFDESLFRYRYSKWIPFKYRNLALAMENELSSAKDVDVLLNAAVTHIQLDPGGRRVESLAFFALDGKRGAVRASQYILCCGAIETARLMLASNDICPQGVGNECGVVGRYFQDHISVECADLKPKLSGQFVDSFSPFFVKDVMHSPRTEFTPEAQQKLGCLSVFGQVLAEPPEDSGFIVVREMLRRMQALQGMFPSLAEIKNILRELPYVMRLGKSRYLGGRLPYPPRSHWHLSVDIEQEPNPDSRILLSDKRDALGMPMAIIDWRVGERERVSAAHFVDAFRKEWERMGLGEAVWHDEIFSPGSEWLVSARDTYHQAGTARMGDNAQSSVVNKNLRVHGISNLYVGSSAVFPCSGGANPTFTIAALCLRLVDHLRSLA